VPVVAFVGRGTWPNPEWGAAFVLPVAIAIPCPCPKREVEVVFVPVVTFVHLELLPNPEVVAMFVPVVAIRHPELGPNPLRLVPADAFVNPGH